MHTTAKPPTKKPVKGIFKACITPPRALSFNAQSIVRLCNEPLFVFSLFKIVDFTKASKLNKLFSFLIDDVFIFACS